MKWVSFFRINSKSSSSSSSSQTESFVRISCLLWADILVAYALFVMQNYLTDVWKLSLTHAAGILNFWNGIYRILPVFFLYFVDSFLGNLKLLVFTSISYTTGIILVAMSTPPVLASTTHTCKQYEPECIGRTQKRLLYAGLVFIAVGVAGNLVSLKPFLEEQKEESVNNSSHNSGTNNASSSAPRGDLYQIVGLVGVVVVALAGAIGLPYIKPWTLRFWIPAGCTAFGTLLFLTGLFYKRYKDKSPNGSPICNVARVYIAATLNIFKSYPVNNQRYHGINQKIFSKTSCLRGLHKAAIKPEGKEDAQISRWRLCTVTEVENAKIAVRMVPMWLTFILCGVVAAAGDTYFVEQAGKLNRRIGKLKLPIQVLLLMRRSVKESLDPRLQKYFKMRSDTTGKKSPSPLMKWTEFDSAPSIGIGLGMICAILCCISAAGVEKMRLKSVRDHGLLNNSDADVPFSIYWLLIQFFFLGGLDSLMEKSVNLYYKEQSPETMENYLVHFTQGVTGLGYMSSTLSVYLVGRISEGGGRRNWFQETLNMSRLDRYYWVLAALSAVNFVVFAMVASRYRYKELGRRGEDIDAPGGYTNGYVESTNACFGCC